MIADLFSLLFWKHAAQRGIRTFAQSVLAVLGGSAFNVWNADWHNAVGVGLGAAALSVLMSIDRGTAVTAVTTLVPPATPSPNVSSGDTAMSDSTAASPGCGNDLRG